MLARRKILHLTTIMDTNRDSDHQFQNKDNFPALSLGLEFINEAGTRDKPKKSKNVCVGAYNDLH